jgi:hypothetical protein
VYFCVEERRPSPRACSHTVFLALSLPRENLEHHFRTTWVGFDLILVLAVYLTAHMAFRLDTRVQAPATVVATLGAYAN